MRVYCHVYRNLDFARIPNTLHRRASGRQALWGLRVHQVAGRIEREGFAAQWAVLRVDPAARRSNICDQQRVRVVGTENFLRGTLGHPSASTVASQQSTLVSAWRMTVSSITVWSPCELVGGERRCAPCKVCSLHVRCRPAAIGCIRTRFVGLSPQAVQRLHDLRLLRPSARRPTPRSSA